MKRFILSAALMASSFFTHASVVQFNDKSIVGELEYIDIQELDTPFLARIDTGANTSSIHAFDVVVEGEQSDSDNMRNHIGHTVSFTTANELGEESKHTGKIVKVSRIRNAQGVERRYGVNLTLNWQGEKKEVTVNLRDRSKLNYKLLIGRNWLEGDYLVDVERSGELD